MEGRGQRPGDIAMTTHWRIPETQRVERCGFDFRVPDAPTVFHDYGVLWQPDRITYFIDRQPVSEIKVPVGFYEPMYMIVNLAMGSKTFEGVGFVDGRISQYCRIRDRQDIRLPDRRTLTGDDDVRKILAPAFCKACRLVRARHCDCAGRRRCASSIRAAGACEFSEDFVWGTATSAYQIEGAVNEDGRGRSIWDTFSHTPGKIEDKTTGDFANDHYHRYKEDIGLIRKLGAKAYRFSIAWPRVFPEGTGKPNPKGLDFYDIEIVSPADKAPDTASAQRVVDLARSRGLLLLKSGTYKNVIRLLPPLTTPPEELSRGLDILAAACREVFA